MVCDGNPDSNSQDHSACQAHGLPSNPWILCLSNVQNFQEIKGNAMAWLTQGMAAMMGMVYEYLTGLRFRLRV
jgi:hypothetical protein